MQRADSIEVISLPSYNMSQSPSPDSFTVGWICALEIEYTVAIELLDEEYDFEFAISLHDDNSYQLGRIKRHNVVIACLPSGRYGTDSAGRVAQHMRRTFPYIQFALMVGIGGGAPSPRHDIRLGDIVVSVPRGTSGGVNNYDFGKLIQEQEFVRTGSLNAPPTRLLAAVSSLRSSHKRRGNGIGKAVAAILERNPRLIRWYQRPPTETDILFDASFLHPETASACDSFCTQRWDRIVSRRPRDDQEDPTIHEGLIASANKLLRDASIRDRLAQTDGYLCFEMEAAGLMNDIPCLVIRGICDYADTHKNDIWHGYAAATAAVYAKELLYAIPSSAANQISSLFTSSLIYPEPRPVRSISEPSISDITSNTEPAMALREHRKALPASIEPVLGVLDVSAHISSHDDFSISTDASNVVFWNHEQALIFPLRLPNPNDEQTSRLLPIRTIAEPGLSIVGASVQSDIAMVVRASEHYGQHYQIGITSAIDPGREIYWMHADVRSYWFLSKDILAVLERKAPAFDLIHLALSGPVFTGFSSWTQPPTTTSRDGQILYSFEQVSLNVNSTGIFFEVQHFWRVTVGRLRSNGMVWSLWSVDISEPSGVQLHKSVFLAHPMSTYEACFFMITRGGHLMLAQRDRLTNMDVPNPEKLEGIAVTEDDSYLVMVHYQRLGPDPQYQRQVYQLSWAPIIFSKEWQEDTDDPHRPKLKLGIRSKPIDLKLKLRVDMQIRIVTQQSADGHTVWVVTSTGDIRMIRIPLS